MPAIQPDDGEQDEHSHVFTSKVENAQTLVSEGNCVTPSVYYYSCLCGEISTLTYHANIVASKHSEDTVSEYIDNGENHYRQEHCSRPTCNAIIGDPVPEDHELDGNTCIKCDATVHVCVFDRENDENIIDAATCSKVAKYAKSCSCGAVSTDPADVYYGKDLLPHDNKVETVAPTCTQKGSKTYTCKVCGHSNVVELDTAGHNYSRVENDQYKVSDATCISKKTYVLVCTTCNHTSNSTYTVGDFDKTKHVGEEEITYTKIDNDYHKQITTCTSCHETIEPSPELPHKWVNGTCEDCKLHVHTYVNNPDSKYLYAAATVCGSKNVYFKSCNTCGDASSETFEYGEPLDHNFNQQLEDDRYIKNYADCNLAKTYYKSCRCGEQGTETFTVGTKLGHSVVTEPQKNPTCTTVGFTESSYCVRCEEILVVPEVIPAKGHTEKTIAGVSPTCVLSGISDYVVCTTCAYVISDSHTVPALGHDMEDVFGYPATCTTPGKADGQTCKRCNYVTGQSTISATGHSIVTDQGWDATCTTSGLTDGSHCSACSEVFVPQEVIVANGHNSVVVGGVAPTCTESGLTSGTKCSVCDMTLTVRESIPATGHNEVVVNGTPATCTSVGSTTGTYCSICNSVLTGASEIAMLPHDYAATIINPSCGIAGLIVYTCSGCSDTYTEVLEALEHMDINGDDTCEICGDKIGGSTPGDDTENPWDDPDPDEVLPDIPFEPVIPDDGEYVIQPGAYVFNWIVTLENIGRQYIEFLWNDGKAYGMEVSYTVSTINRPPRPATEIFYFDLAVFLTPELANTYGQKVPWQSSTNGMENDWVETNRTLIIETPQVVSEQFYNWFNANTEEGVAISGKWQFKSTGISTFPKEYFEYVKIKYGAGFENEKNGFYWSTSCIGFGDDPIQYGFVDSNCYTKVYNFASQSWIEAPNASVDFGEEVQYISTSVYNWICANAEPIVETDCNHQMTATILRDATCSKSGVVTNICSLCGFLEYNVIPKLPHTLVTYPELAPTCTTSGYTSESICSVCNAVTIRKQTLNALGHNFETTSSLEPTCTRDGNIINKCTRCNLIETIVLDRKDCIDNNNDYVCDICGQVATFTFYISGQPYVARKDMTWGEWCESEYNTFGFENFNNATPLKIDLSVEKVYKIMQAHYSDGSFLVEVVKSSTVIDKSASYSLASVDSNPAWSYLQILPSGKILNGKGEYSDHDEVAKALGRGEISLIIRNNVIIRTYEDCYYEHKVFVYVEDMLYDVEVGEKYNVLERYQLSIHISVSGEVANPQGITWYHADKNGNKLDDTVVATGPIGPSLGHGYHPYIAVFVSGPYVYDGLTTYEWGTQNTVGNVETYLYDENGNLIDTAISAADGKVSLTIPRPGTYTWEYLGSHIVFTMDSFGRIKYVEYMYEPVEFSLPIKKESTIDFYTLDDQHLLTLVTNADGTFTLSKLTNGEFYFYIGKTKYFLNVVSNETGKDGTVTWGNWSLKP